MGFALWERPSSGNCCKNVAGGSPGSVVCIHCKKKKPKGRNVGGGENSGRFRIDQRIGKEVEGLWVAP